VIRESGLDGEVGGKSGWGRRKGGDTREWVGLGGEIGERRRGV